jgi:RHS repeat-associated protein
VTVRSVVRTGARPGLARPGLMRPGLTRPGLMRPGLARLGLMRPGLALMRLGLMRPGRVRLGVSLVAAVVLVPVQAAAAAPAVAAARPVPPRVQQDRVVAGHTAPPATLARPALRTVAVPAPAWPAATSVEVPLTATAGAGSHGAGSPRTDPAAAGAGAAGAGAAGPGAAVAGPVRLAAGGAGAPGRVKVQVYGHADAAAAGVNGLLLRLARTDGGAAAGPVAVSVDYAALRGAYGADWASRLRLVALTGCAASPPPAGAAPAAGPAAGPAGTTPTSARIPPTGAEVGAAPVPTGCRLAELRSVNRPDLGTVSGTVQVAASGTVLAAAASPSGGSGSFAATDLKPSASWSAGSNTGEFTWSYPLSVPPGLGGPVPSVALAYSSAAVDGSESATNNQPSWIGEGFGYAPGSIDRSYIGCAQDMGGTANNTTATGDLCYRTDNATLSLPGHAGGELLQDADDGSRWHMRGDDGTYIRHLSGAGNGAQNGEWWQVTTTDGTRYSFGGTASAGSTWTEPVYGNNSGEPCHQSTFAASSCPQAYRWLLDQVTDASGNTMTFHYTKQTNSYAADNDTGTLASYVRGGYLTEIDYGTRTGGTAPAPVRVLFSTGDRCVTSSCGTHDATNWPDTPWDQQCTATPCYNGSPTFWSTVMLKSVATQIYSGTGSTYTTVGTWTLGHSFPDPGDGTRAGLWLTSIQHTGMAGGVSTSLPAVTFTPVQMANRVEAVNGLAPMNWLRIAKITTETGAQIQVTYSPPECVPGSRMPDLSDLPDNTYRCYPVVTPASGTDPGKTEFFHKYRVDQVNVADLTTPGNPTTTTAYTYLGTPAWHYTDDNGLVVPGTKTWSVWRGYGDVKATTGVGAEAATTETRYFRGMDGDHLPTGTRSVTISAVDVDGNGSTADAIDASATADDDAFDGLARQRITWNGTAMVSESVSTPWRSAATATRTAGGITVNARIVNPGADQRTVTALDGGRAPRITSAHTDYDTTYGLPVRVDDSGDTAVTGDERCRLTTYNQRTTTDGATWLVDFPSRVQTFATGCATAQGGGTLTADQVTGDTLTYYDGATSTTTPPTRGLSTRVDTLKDWVNGAPAYLTSSRTGYDANGRVTSATDVRGNTTATAYTANTGGQVVTTTATSALGWVTSTALDPATGQDLSVTDPNGRITARAYDGLGRLTGGWQPGRDRATQSPNVSYAYLVRTNAPNVVTTSTLLPTGGYLTSYALSDGMLRPRQTQAPRGDGAAGALVTDTCYDTAGRPYLVNAPYLAAATPGTSLFVPNQLGDVPRYTVTSYDPAGRPVTATVYLNTTGTPVPYATTTTGYGGDRTDVTPPAGGTATSTLTDARGNTVELRQYHGPSPTPFTAGSYDATRYHFDANGRQDRHTDAAGNIWATSYDVRGRPVSATDPDRGTTTSTYDDAGDVLTSTDARGTTVASSYDSIGRRTGLYAGSVAAANQLTAWSYDGLTNSRGQLTASTTYRGGSGGDAYTMSVLGLTATYQPTSVRYTIPAAETGLAGSYTYAYSYNADGSAATTRLPSLDGGIMGTETLTQGYTALGQPYSLATSLPTATTLVPATSYTGYGETATITLQFNGGNTAWLASSYTPGTRTLAGQLTTRQVAPATLADVRYSYDPAGNPTSITDAAAGDTQCFGYDYLDRMTSAWTPAGGDCTAAPTAAGLGGPAPYWTDWTFTPTGTRASQTSHDTAGGTATTTYGTPAPGAPQPHTVTSAATTDATGTRTATWTYDPAGDTTGRTTPAGTAQTLTWNPEGRLDTLTDTNTAGSSSYRYDADGNRLISRDPTGATLYLPGQELRYTAATGTKATTRYYSSAGHALAMRTAAGITWLSADNHGTASTTISAATQTAATRRYDPYGNPRGTTGTWPTTLTKGYIGGTTDPTGLTHIGAREYDPQAGRFLSTDPEPDPTNPQTLNNYAYANNNPATNTDPTGRRFVPPGSGSGSVGGGAGGGSGGGGGGGGTRGVTPGDGHDDPPPPVPYRCYAWYDFRCNFAINQSTMPQNRAIPGSPGTAVGPTLVPVRSRNGSGLCPYVRDGRSALLCTTGNRRYVDQVVKYGVQAGIDPRLLLTIIMNESFMPVWFGEDKGVTNMSQAVFDDIRKHHSEIVGSRTFHDIEYDSDFAIKLAAYYLADIKTSLPTTFSGEARALRRDEMLAIGWHTGVPNMQRIANGQDVGPRAQGYVVITGDNWSQADYLICHTGLYEC